MSIPSMSELSPMFSDEASCMRFLLNNNAIYRTLDCCKCKSTMNREAARFRCSNCACRAEMTFLHEPFFSGSRLEVNQMLFLGYLWPAKTPFDLARTFTGHSRSIISACYSHLRQSVTDSLDDDGTLLGEDGIIVEIDESKFGKRKYNRGHRVDGCWVLGGV